MTVKVVLEGVGDLAAALAAIPDKVHAAAGAAVEESARILQRASEQTAPHVTGRLSRSVVIDGPVRSGLGWTAEVGPSKAKAPYARAVELGMEPRTIYPRSKQALFWPGAAYPVPYVNWPGFAGRKWFEDAFYLSTPAFRTAFERAMQKALFG